MTRMVGGLEALAGRFDAFLVDQFGVVLDGVGAYPFAPAALARLAAQGKPVLFLSNSGKRAAANEARLGALGFRRGDYLGVLSSGEAAHGLLARRIGADIGAGAPVWLHGRDDDASAVAGLDLRRCEDPAQAALIVLAGSRGEVMTLGDYARLLAPAARAGVPCLCTNPDLTMLTARGRHFGAGRIAALYAELGGSVDYVGKPHPLIYAEAARRLPGIAPGRILCIGDSPAHDLAGGRAAGHATALVRSGIHAGLDDAALAALCAAEGAAPDFILPAFDFAPDPAPDPAPEEQPWPSPSR